MSAASSKNGSGAHASVVFFCLSVVLVNHLFYVSGLGPRWISVWALIAVVPYLAGGLLVLLDVLTQTQAGVMFVPLAINEMVLAVWLLVKGFRTSDGS